MAGLPIGVKRNGAVDFVRPIDPIAGELPIARMTLSTGVTVGEPFDIYMLTSENPGGDPAALTLSAAITSQPSGSSVTLTEVTRGHFRFTPTRNGDYVVQGSATNSEGTNTVTRTFTASGYTPPPDPIPGKLGETSTSTVEARLLTDPNVLWVATFEDSNWMTIHGVQNGDFGNGNTTVGDYSQGFGKNLRFRVPAGATKGGGFHMNFADIGLAPMEEAYFRYRVRFSSNWPGGGGHGKLPGLAGKASTGPVWAVGAGGQRWNGSTQVPQNNLGSADGWSFRLLHQPDFGASTYLYVPNPIGRVTTNRTYGQSTRLSVGGQQANLLDADGWTTIEQYVKLNTPGSNNGIGRVWVNGELAYDRNTIQYRGPNRANVQISQMFVTIFMGGGLGDAPSSTVYGYVDDMVISKAYVGRRV